MEDHVVARVAGRAHRPQDDIAGFDLLSASERPLAFFRPERKDRSARGPRQRRRARRVIHVVVGEKDRGDRPGFTRDGIDVALISRPGIDHQ